MEMRYLWEQWWSLCIHRYVGVFKRRRWACH